MNPIVRPLVREEAGAYVALRREMLEDSPFAFLASPDDDFASDVDAVRANLASGPDRVTFGAFGPGLIGVAGVIRERHAKTSHKANLWGVYVTPAARGRGVGRRLIDAALAHARTLPGLMQVTLSVSDRTPAARRLYESAGFRVWGTEPRALRFDGSGADEHHMVLFL